MSWNEILHPRDHKGRFSFKGAVKKTPLGNKRFRKAYKSSVKVAFETGLKGAAAGAAGGLLGGPGTMAVGAGGGFASGYVAGGIDEALHQRALMKQASARRRTNKFHK